MSRTKSSTLTGRLMTVLCASPEEIFYIQKTTQLVLFNYLIQFLCEEGMSLDLINLVHDTLCRSPLCIWTGLCTINVIPSTSHFRWKRLLTWFIFTLNMLKFLAWFTLVCQLESEMVATAVTLSSILYITIRLLLLHLICLACLIQQIILFLVIILDDVLQFCYWWTMLISIQICWKNMTVDYSYIIQM